MYNQSALKQLKKLLLQKYPEYIEKMILFGSRVEGTEREYSDYDILLILKKPFDWKFENSIFETCFDINLKYDIITDVKIISKNDLNTLKGKQLFVQNAINYGVVI